MTIDTNSMISITEANQNFSKVARVVDEHGTAVILKNNVPRYLVIDFSKAEQEKLHQQKMYLQFLSALLNKIVFMALNGYELSYIQKELSNIILDLASGRIMAEDIVRWIISHQK